MTSFKENVDLFKAWIRQPLKMLHLLWFICVFASFISLLILLSGFLDHKLVTKRERDLWLEVNIQIVNLLFTFLSLYTHPRWCYRLFLLCRWRPEDAMSLRKIYCKNGEQKPNERAHMMVIVILNQVACFLIYIVCALVWRYSSPKIPVKAIGTIVFVIVCSAISANLYRSFSSLQDDPKSGEDIEAPIVKG